MTDTQCLLCMGENSRDHVCQERWLRHTLETLVMGYDRNAPPKNIECRRIMRIIQMIDGMQRRRSIWDPCIAQLDNSKGRN